MQKRMIKLIVNVCLSFGILLIFSLQSFADSSVIFRLEEADSLFEQQKYIKAQELYVELLEKEELYSPRMLLRMSFIEEGQENYAEALYYLNLHYHLTSNRKTLYKIGELAETQNLEGYKSSDFEFFSSVFYTYYQQIGIVVLILIVGILIGIYKRKKNELHLIPAYAFMVVLILTALVIFNKGLRKDKAIVSTEHAWAMSSPSAGSKKVGIVSKGNRLEVIGEEDIWYKVDWEGTEAYIRQSNLMVVE